MQLFLFLEGYLAPPKTIKKHQNLEYTVIPVLEGLSKTIKNHQKPLENTGFLVF
jgi:hypothetical protein